MNAFSIGRCALIGIISLAAPLFAQTPPTPAFSQAVTTGIVSISPNQSAQLNVLNLNPVPAKAGSTVPLCAVQLEFHDAQNNLLKQLLVPNIPPGTAASLTLNHTEAKLAGTHVDIRGVVRTGPLTPAASATSPIANNACTVMVTLEISNDITGDTQLVTSDTHTLWTPVAVPLPK